MLTVAAVVGAVAKPVLVGAAELERVEVTMLAAALRSKVEKSQCLVLTKRERESTHLALALETLATLALDALATLALDALETLARDALAAEAEDAAARDEAAATEAED